MDSSTRGAGSDGWLIRSRFAALAYELRYVSDRAVKRGAGKWRPKERQSWDAARQLLRGASKRHDRQVLCPAAVFDDEFNMTMPDPRDPDRCTVQIAYGSKLTLHQCCAVIFL